MAVLTPMMQQYKEIKASLPDTILLFRVGDFYELFFEDAKIAARELEIALTSRDGNKDTGIPLAGVPHHAVQNYIARLLDKGYKVAICDQVEDASQAKGLVRREVTRVITPGTKIEDSFLEEKKNNYLASVSKMNRESDHFGLAFIDISTGDLFAMQLEGIELAVNELFCFQPAEIIFDGCAAKDPEFKQHLCKFVPDTATHVEPSVEDPEEAYALLQRHFSAEVLAHARLEQYPAALRATATAVSYVTRMQTFGLGHIHRIQVMERNEALRLDAITMRNLEITETLRTREKQRSLLGLLDQTRTAMGGRQLRKWLEKPLLSGPRMQRRWDAVEELQANLYRREELIGFLKSCYDLERLSGRISMGQVNPRDFLALKKTLQIIPEIQRSLARLSNAKINEITQQLPDYTGLAQILQKAIAEDAPFALKEGNIFKDGYSPEVDELRKLSRNSKQWIIQLEKEERERTGIKTLKVGYNRVFGYYLEVTRANSHLVPEDYMRKQTLVNAERFITEDLKEKESHILHAQEKLAQLEYTLFEELRGEIAAYTLSLQRTGRLLGVLDCLCSLAETASTHNFVKPSLVEQFAETTIKDARHPVVEFTQESPFVPNDFCPAGKRILVLTGPNMAGKSTYCRSIALLYVMAQAGGFVPAREMKFTPLEQIFARVGASDDLSSGRSTFMVEMEETSSILSQVCPQSLVVLDEIGRGTSTYDGMSLAQAVLEFLHDRTAAKVLFSTHYHELTALDLHFSAVKNYCVAVKEKGEEIIFLHKVVSGKADKSYGINVARLAGLPEQVTLRAREILSGLEREQERQGGEGDYAGQEMESGQLSLVREPADSAPRSRKEEKVLQEIIALKIVNMTPLQALNSLYSMQSQLLGRDSSLKEKDK